MPSQVNCKLQRAAPSCSWIVWLITQKWHLSDINLIRRKFFIFSSVALKILQCGRKKWQKSVTVYRQLFSYIDCSDREICASCYDYHDSLMFTRPWFYFVMEKRRAGLARIPVEKVGFCYQSVLLFVSTHF